MARELNDIFNECYERIRIGESLNSCLARYPEHAAELRMLLKTAFDIGRRASYIQPRPEFKHWTQVKLQRPQHHVRQQKQVARPSLLSWQRSWAVAVAVILVILLAGVGTAAASSDAQPDQALYPVKLATEQVRVALAFSEEQKAQVLTQLAETRAVEVETMANEGKTEQAALTAERLADQLKQADYAMLRVQGAEAGNVKTLAVPQPTAPAPAPTPTPAPTATTPAPASTPETTPPEPVSGPTAAPPATAGTQEQAVVSQKTEKLRQSLDESTSKSLAALQSALEKAPPQAKPSLQQAIDRISEQSQGKPPPEQNQGTGNTHDKDRNQNRNSGSSDNTTQIPPQSQQNQPSVHKDDKNQGEPTQVTPDSSQQSTGNNDSGGNAADTGHNRKDNHH